ncbi:putative white collar protein [Neofusicoccum parvum UCRNP2]|uniref:PAS domain-containing protein n=2 Tax=Neofusicoccum parvum TaxID=310453 RepID=A0ACB5RNP0_9PEZI|nr:putative white collar protein [Neofusicoccum parvum UCRNP2]GME22130.1 PAS domain-containing protein [Neofusicoccum parvum]
MNGYYPIDQPDSGDNMMGVMGQDEMGPNMMVGHSLDDIVNQNSKAMRRQSVPVHYTSGRQSDLETDMRRVSMMEFSGAAPGQLDQFQFDPATAAPNMDSLMSVGDGFARRNSGYQQRRRPSAGDLSLDTRLHNAQQQYDNMAPPGSYASPLAPTTGLDMGMTSPYVSAGLSMSMDMQDPSLSMMNAGDGTPMQMYSQAQFASPLMGSPIGPDFTDPMHPIPDAGENAGPGNGKVEAGCKRKYVDDDSVLYLKNMINTQKEAQISLINYRRGGQPFMNLLTMIPITWDDSEVVKFFVGFQVDLVEQPNSVTNKNPDGTYSINYQRSVGMPRYVFNTPEQTQSMEMGQTIPRDDVSALLDTLVNGESEASKRLWDKALLENTDDVIHVLSLKGLFLYLSPSAAKVLEYEASELVGTALSSVCHPSDIVPVMRELKDTSAGSAVNVVFRIRRKHSGYMWFEGHGSLHTEQGKGRKCIILVDVDVWNVFVCFV